MYVPGVWIFHIFLIPMLKRDYLLFLRQKVKFQSMQNTTCLDEEIINEVRGAILTHGHAVVAKNCQ